ncbi:MAG: hypothetical protein NTX52_04450, partial [Planctomycetota bacterium]|nr:hypothetical protein [Planctomycetota bacterium]
DGSIVGWGENWCGAATPPAGNDFVAIAAGGATVCFLSGACGTIGYSLALKSDGSIVGWGDNGYGQASPPDGNDFVSIAAGEYHSLAIREQGPAELMLIQPNVGEKLIADRIYTIEWQSSGSINQVLIEFSDSNGVSWTAVSPPNAGNNRRYNWLVPKVNSEQCLVRITDVGDQSISDVSDAVFTIYQCTLKFDVTGDCLVDLRDFASFASEWLQCGNPFDPNCLQ